MESEAKTEREVLMRLSENKALLEIGRKAIEDVLVDMRDSRISMIRGNGLVIRGSDGKESYIIRMGPEDALRIGLRAIAEYDESAYLASINAATPDFASPQSRNDNATPAGGQPI